MRLTLPGGLGRRALVRFRKISHEHGDRTTAEVLAELDKIAM